MFPFIKADVPEYNNDNAFSQFHEILAISWTHSVDLKNFLEIDKNFH